MKKSITLIIVIILQLNWIHLHAISPVHVAEGVIRIDASAEESLYYGFAAGDQIEFSFEEVNGELLQKIAITELPSSTKVMDHQCSKINSKSIHVTQKGIFKFCFVNAAGSSRKCKFKIRRIPANDETKAFDTSVRWKTSFDTIYTVENEKYLIKADTTIENLTNQIARVNPTLTLSGNKTSFNFSLPENCVSWSYYIGVDQAGVSGYESSKTKIFRNAGSVISHIPEYGPMAALALYGISYFSQMMTGEDIDFYFLDNNQVRNYMEGRSFEYIKKGKVINDFSRMTYPLKGTLHLCLMNDNAVQPVSVIIKITAIVVNKRWGIRATKKMNMEKNSIPYLN